LSASTPRILLIEAAAAFATALRAEASLQGCVFEAATGEADALRRLRGRSCDLVITSPHTTISRDLALLSEMREVRPGLKTILLAPEAATEDVIAALRASVFAVFAFPHDPSEVASMAHRALDAGTWQDGIEVRSAQPDWLSMRVDCRRLSAERVMTFLRELRPDIPEEARDEALTGFREVLLNAMEHGGQFDPDKVVEISAVRTAACAASRLARLMPSSATRCSPPSIRHSKTSKSWSWTMALRTRLPRLRDPLARWSASSASPTGARLRPGIVGYGRRAAVSSPSSTPTTSGTSRW